MPASSFLKSRSALRRIPLLTLARIVDTFVVFILFVQDEMGAG
jgi:hypothetical protein